MSTAYEKLLQEISALHRQMNAMEKRGGNVVPIERAHEIRRERMSPFYRGWDWDRRARTAWFDAMRFSPVRSGLYEVRKRGEDSERLVEFDDGWKDDMRAGDRWRGLRKGFFSRYQTPYRPKLSPDDPTPRRPSMKLHVGAR